MNQRQCPVCSTPLSDDLPDALCPACLLAASQPNDGSVSEIETEHLGDRMRPPEPSQLAELFPDLDVIDLVGFGGMGAVYKARQRSLDRFVALKIILLKDQDQHLSERFAREARALARLNHPNIVTVHDFGQRGRFHFLLMEFIDGTNLRQLSSTRKLTAAEALQLVPQLCDALQYAHNHEVVHRDIKPENVLLDKSGQIKIADFGLAKLTGTADPGLTHSQQVMGTLRYMAPEQLERPTEVDHRADIYSLGVVIYELLTGELPMGRFDPPSTKSDVDRRLDEVVLRALEKEPNRRYQQASEFKTSVETMKVPPIRQAAQPPDATAADDDKSLFDIFVFSIAMLISCVGVFVLSVAHRGVLPLSSNEAQLVGILILMFGGYFFAVKAYASQLLDVSCAPIARLNAGLGAVGLLMAIISGGYFVTAAKLDRYADVGRALGLAFAIGSGFVYTVYGMISSKYESNGD